MGLRRGQRNAEGRLSEKWQNVQVSLSFFFSSIPYTTEYYLRPYFSILVVTQIRGHIAGSAPPPDYGSCLAFFYEYDCVTAKWEETRHHRHEVCARRQADLGLGT